MNVRWMKKMIVPVMAMLFVYYASNYMGGLEPVNQVNSINGLTELANSDVHATSEELQIVYGLHDSNYLVRSTVERNPHVSWVYSIFDALTTEQGRLGDHVTSLIPENAELINYEFDDFGGITLNLSREFLEYDASWERQLLSSLVWSFTENGEIDRVFFKIEGEPVANLNSALNVSNGLTRGMGINLELETASVNSQQVLLYFLVGESSHPYMVPVTRIVDASMDPVTYAVNALSEGPRGASYLSVISHTANLIEDPLLTDGVLTLNFDSGLFFDQGQTVVSSTAITQLVMTLTAQEGVDSVSVLIEGSTRVFDDRTRPIAVPVGRDVVDPFVSAQ